MKNAVLPISLDASIHAAVKATSKTTGLSQAELMRQAMKLGLAQVKRKTAHSRSKPSLFESLRALGPVKLKRR